MQRHLYSVYVLTHAQTYVILNANQRTRSGGGLGTRLSYIVGYMHAETELESTGGAQSVCRASHLDY